MVLTPFLAHGFALLVALLGPGAFASELSLAEIHCVAGATASGGCFNQALAAYQDALICFVPLAVCRRGLHRPGERALAPTDLLVIWPGCACSSVLRRSRAAALVSALKPGLKTLGRPALE